MGYHSMGDVTILILCTVVAGIVGALLMALTNEWTWTEAARTACSAFIVPVVY